MDEYGAYMELIYLHTKDSMLLDMDRVFKLPATQFLFISEYLIRKNKVEADEIAASTKRI